ncbi:MAG: AraC family transcriptional regulator ligand-binding domain-containing protein [Geminicoccaceae bacterium]
MAELAIRLPDPNPGASSLDVLARLGTAQLEAMGVDWRPIAAAHALDLEAAPVEGIRIPTHDEHAFLAEAARASRDPLFSWRLGDMSLKDFGLLGYAILNARTVGEALDTLSALIPAICEANSYRTVVDGDTASLVYASSDSWQNSVFTLRIALNLLRDVVGPEFAPTRVGISVLERDHLDAVARQVQAPVGAELPITFVSFPARHLRSRIAGADDRLAETLRPYWQRQLTVIGAQPAVVRTRLENAVVANLHQGVPTLEQLATYLDMGRAKVASELASVGGSRSLVDGVRRRLAQELVQSPDLTTARIAELLGFSEPGALNHAYRRWTGHAPTADRPLLGADGAPVRSIESARKAPSRPKRSAEGG